MTLSANVHVKSGAGYPVPLQERLVELPQTASTEVDWLETFADTEFNMNDKRE